MVRPGGDSTVTVVVAFVANLVIAAAKTFAATVSGSASMTAEAAHSWADTGNEVFLLVANRRSSRDADERRPLGYGRETYVWSLLAAVGLFVVGAAVSIWRGVAELLHGGEPSVRFLRPEFIGPKQLFVIASVDLVGDAVESSIARTLRDLEHRLELERFVTEAVLTVSEPDDTGIPAFVSTPKPSKTTESDSGPSGREDVQSDPAKGAEDRSDWSDEGGATTDGPAEQS